MAEQASTLKPFLSTYSGNFVEGYDSIEEATANVAARNSEAKALGLAGTYEVHEGARKS